MRNIVVKKKKWPRKNLGELIAFLEERNPGGVALENVAQLLGTTPQAISNIFRRDDIKLSKAEQIARAYGYELRLFYPVRTFNDGYVPTKPVYSYPNAGNLSGLIKYIHDSEYCFTFIAERMGMHPTTISKVFKTGDINISKLNMLLDALNIYVHWNFIKI